MRKWFSAQKGESEARTTHRIQLIPTEVEIGENLMRKRFSPLLVPGLSYLGMDLVNSSTVILLSKGESQ
jgi:hypothetical protein